MSGSKEKRLDMLLKILEKETPAGGISGDQIIKRLGMKSRQSLANYIEELRGRDLPVECRKEQRTPLYYLAEKKQKRAVAAGAKREKDDGAELPAPIDRNAVLRYHVTRILESERDREMNLHEIKRQMDLRASEMWETVVEQYQKKSKDMMAVKVRREELKTVIEDMVGRGEVIRTLSTGDALEDEPLEIYHLAPRSVPVVLELNEEQCWEFFAMLENLKGGTPFDKHWESIHQKVATALGAEQSAVFEDERVIAVGRAYMHFDSVQERMRLFDGIPFRTTMVRGKLRDKSGEHWEEFGVGAIVYSVEKDKLYIVTHRKGKRVKKSALPKKEQQSSRRDVYRIIDMDQLLKVSATNRKNDWYDSEDCRSFLDTAFSVSTEKTVRVEVRFKNTERNRKLLSGLEARRRHALYEEQSDALLYSDTVSGIGDFANFLRQFGSEARVIAPQKLKERMAATAQRVLERYGEVEHA
ncbi:MAG: WYL domain-containing protein [Lachnospiraceae bacterium]|nr:WYL domain-containing protein [Lachnospiraceae bacterium]